MEKFVQKFRRATSRSVYKERVLVEKFKRRVNKIIRKKLMKAKRSLRSVR